MARCLIQFLDRNQFFSKNGSFYYYRPGTSYLDKFTHGLSLDSVLYSRELVSLAAKPTEKIVSHNAETTPHQIKYEYDERIETRAKLPGRTSKKKLSKREFLALRKPASKKLAFIPKRSKTNKLNAIDTKSWHRGEYTRTNPDSHNDECECQGCAEHNEIMGGWCSRDDDDDERDWCDFLSDVSDDEEYDGPERIAEPDDDFKYEEHRYGVSNTRRYDVHGHN
jgi:hypothetical protein